MARLGNAAPRVDDQGTQDFSGTTPAVGSAGLPQHVPLYYIFAEKGKMGRQYVDFADASLTQLFGDKTFDPNEKYFQHTTQFLRGAAAVANNCVVCRVPGQGMNDVANVTIYLDVLPAQVPLYIKGRDGSVVLDADGNETFATDEDGAQRTVAGYKLCWVVDHDSVALGQYTPKTKTVRPGIQVDGATQSVQYPIFEFTAADAGEAGIRMGVRLSAAMQSDLTAFPSSVLEDSGSYPYYFQLFKVTDTVTGSTAPVLHAFGGQNARFVAEKGCVDVSSGAIIDLERVVDLNYAALDDTADATGLGLAHIYYANLKQLTDLFFAAESVIDDPYRDTVVSTGSEAYSSAINILSFTSSNGSPYQALRLVNPVGSVRLTKNTNIFFAGGTDGEMSADLLDSFVLADMDNYNNSLHEYNDMVLHPETCVIDSGYTLATKKALFKMISRRKDTYVIHATYAHDAPAATLEDQYSVGVALKSIAELYPESSFYGTPVMRAAVFGGGCEVIGSDYTGRIPTTYEIAYMMGRCMGAADGAWRRQFLFDRAPRSVVTQVKNLDVTWVPVLTRGFMWAAGVNFALNYKVKSQFFPAMQTLYEDDTSVLNSLFTIVAIAHINRVEHAAWREFSGNISLSEGELVQAVNDFIASELKGKFGELFTIIPDAKVTAYDSQLGWRWTTNVKIGANPMKTAMTASVGAYRNADLQA